MNERPLFRLVQTRFQLVPVPENFVIKRTVEVTAPTKQPHKHDKYFGTLFTEVVNRFTRDDMLGKFSSATFIFCAIQLMSVLKIKRHVLTII